MAATKPHAAIWILAALATFAAARLAPPLDGLTPLGQATLGVLLAGTLLWVSEALPLGTTAVLVLALLGLCPDLRLPDIAGGFTSDVTFFLIGAVAIGTAVETSGLASRAATVLTRSARGRPARLYVQMIAAFPFLALMVPSAITRNAILIPAYGEALKGIGAGASSKAGRAVMLALGMLNPLASSALLTGGITSITAATLLGGFSWLHWFALMAVPYYVLLLAGAIWIRVIVGPFEAATAPQTQALASKPFSAAEWRTLAVLAATSLLWFTDHVHHLSPAIPALLGAALLLLPGAGALAWKTFESRLSWGLILTVATSLSLAMLMTRSGAAAWIGQLVLGRASALSASPLLLVVVIIVSAAVIHLAVTNLAACIALLLPINATVAESAGLNPVTTGLIITIVVDAVILYPVQTAANLMAYESGAFDAADVRKLGLGMLVLTIVTALLVLPYWSLLGLSLTAP